MLQKLNSDKESFPALESYCVSVVLFKSEIAKGGKKRNDRKRCRSFYYIQQKLYLIFLNSALEFSSGGQIEVAESYWKTQRLPL